MSFDLLLQNINRFIINPLILLMFAVSVLVFFYGFWGLIGGAGDEEARSKGKKNLLWGLIGMFIMVSVYGIMNLVLGTFGVDCPPFLPNC